MTSTREMLEASPAQVAFDLNDVVEGIDRCLAAVQACTSCADSSLAEDEMAEMRDCIGLCLICVQVCGAVAALLSRPGQADHYVLHRLLEGCVRACSECAEECERHGAHHRHCAICARVCRACERACSVLLEDEAFQELEKLAGG